ncbi:MAG: efflux RND transporter periplasmic adaptor subunit [Akkermansiaceae bacterium]
MNSTGPNLGQLFSKPTDEAPRPRKRLSVWILPMALIAGFALIFATLFRDRLLPAKAVEIIPAVGLAEQFESKTDASSPARTGELLFQASGWIEPDPLPIKATALTDGIVDQVHVLEGELVKRGDLIASLIDIDTKLRRDAMAAKLADAKASFDAHCVGTQIRLQRMEIAKANLAIAEANAEETGQKLDRYQRLAKGAISEDEMLAVRLDNERMLAEVDADKARIVEIAEELNRISYEILAIQARIRASEIDLAEAQLAYDRTKITAPTDGRIQELKAAPGQKKMLGMEGEDSATIAILYQPDHLQVRVDVPLADAAGLSVGQRAKIRCNLLPDQVFEGEVTRIEGAADLQRNTLQAKVRIEKPSDKMRPDMLCRVEFFETRQMADPNTTGISGVAVYVPESAIDEGCLWICNPDTMRAEKRSVTISQTREGMVRIDAGVRPGEWIVANPSELQSGQRLKPLSSDPT